MWSYNYDEGVDETVIYYDDEKVGSYDGDVGRVVDGIPIKSKDIIRDFVDCNATFDLLFGFHKREK